MTINRKQRHVTILIIYKCVDLIFPQHITAAKNVIPLKKRCWSATCPLTLWNSFSLKVGFTLTLHAFIIPWHIASFSSFRSLQMCTFLISPSLFLLLRYLFSPHLNLLSLNPSGFDFVFLLLSSLCVSLLGSILTPLNARALINQCRVALFHRDPKQLVSFPVCLCLPVCCCCTSVCLCTWHARLHAMSFAELCKSDKYARMRKGSRMVHGGFVANQFACIQKHAKKKKNLFMTR